MVRWNMDNIPQIPFREGFTARTMKLDDIPLWMEVIRDSNVTPDTADDRFFREFGDDLAAIEQRCFLIMAPNGEAAGTISAWYREFHDMDFGLIHWVAMKPSYQGLGLGKAGLSYALNRMAEWHDRCWLNTSSGKIPAISMYLNFGFEPDMDAVNAAEAWGEVQSVLNHPMLEKLGL